MPQEEKTTVVRDGQIDDRYDARCIESNVRTLAAGRVSLCAEPIPRGRNITCLKCCLSLGRVHHGARAQLRIGDAPGALHVDERFTTCCSMGWDSFGLPAENCRIQNNTPPREWTLRNIAP